MPTVVGDSSIAATFITSYDTSCFASGMTKWLPVAATSAAVVTPMTALFAIPRTDCGTHFHILTTQFPGRGTNQCQA